jgi:hypothetical protein
MADGQKRRTAVKGGVMKRALALVGVLLATRAAAHTVWADGSSVPEWVRDACCGPSDIHHLTPDQVSLTPEGYRVDGIQAIVPFSKTLKSQDGDYWIFYRNYADGSQYVFCFFAPPMGF